MKLLFLSPHFPPNYGLFCRALAEKGVSVLGLGDTSHDKLPAFLRSSLTEYAHLHLENYDAVLRTVGLLTYRHGKIDRIESHNEHWLELEARLRTDFNVPGPTIHDLPAMKKKSQMKQVFIDTGLDVVQGRRIGSYEEAEAFLRDVGYPVVVKPDTGVGATGTFRLDTPSDLRAFFDRKARERPSGDPFFEEFIEGQIITYDGLADASGEPAFCTSHVYSHGVMEVVNHDLHVAYYSLREIPADVEAAGKKLLRAYKVRDRFFHFEFFRRTRDQALLALEVNLRPPGGMTMDMFNYANDIDLYRGWANLVTSGTLGYTYDRPYFCCYISRKDRFAYRYPHEELLRFFGPRLRHFGPVLPLFRRGMGDTAYIVTSPSLDEIHAMIDAAHHLTPESPR